MLPSFKPDTVIRDFMGSLVKTLHAVLHFGFVVIFFFKIISITRYPSSCILGILSLRPHISSCCPAVSGPAAAFKEEADWSLNTKRRYAPVLGTQEWRSRVQQLPITSFTTDLHMFRCCSFEGMYCGVSIGPMHVSCGVAVQRAACRHTSSHSLFWMLISFYLLAWLRMGASCDGSSPRAHQPLYQQILLQKSVTSL